MTLFARGASLVYWAMTLGWLVIVPISLACFFAGGFFVLGLYWCWWESLRELKEDAKAVRAAGSKGLGEAIDWHIARTPPPAPSPYVYIGGGENIGGPAGNIDLGYPITRRPGPRVSDRLAICPRCRARYYVATLAECRFCAARLDRQR